MSVRNLTCIAVGCALIFAGLAGCSPGRQALSEAHWQQMEELVEARDFTFVARRIETYGSMPETLIDNPGYLTVDGNQVRMQLRFFGATQISSGYGAKKGFRANGPLSGVHYSRNEERRSLDLSFRVDAADAESLNCDLILFPGKKAVLIVNSNLRNPMRYDGFVE